MPDPLDPFDPFAGLPYRSAVTCPSSRMRALFDVVTGAVRSSAALAELVRLSAGIPDPMDLDPASLRAADPREQYRRTA